MYEIWVDKENIIGCTDDLDTAMKIAKYHGKFVVIRGPEMEIAGVFGVGAAPSDYHWSKDYSLGKRKSKKEWKRDETKTDR